MRQGRARGAWVIAILGLGVVNSAVNAALEPGEDFVLPDGMLGVRVAPMLLLTRREVQAELGLSAEQVASASRTLADLRGRGQRLRGQGNTPEVIAGRRAIDEIQWRWIADELTAEQRDRLNQIDIQWEGPTALIRPSVVDSLGLSDDQRARLTRHVAEGAKHPDGPAGSQADLFRKMVGELTPDQRDRWKVMLGTSFRVVPSPSSATATTPAADAGVRRASVRP